MIDRFGGFNLDGAHQLLTAIGRCEDQVWKNDHLPYFYGNRLLRAYIRGHLVAPFQAKLE
jgi:hypothetical protein